MLTIRSGRGRRLQWKVLLLGLAAAAFGVAPAKSPRSEIDLAACERKVFSQNGEDGVIEKVFEVIKPTSKFCIEFGGGDGVTMSNVRNLILNHGWRSLMIEGDHKLSLQCQSTYRETPGVTCLEHWVYPGNVEFLFEEHGVPEDVDFLVIDIDSFDYYVWKVIHRFRPKLVMIEVNGVFAPPIRAIVEYNPFLYWDFSFYYGASLQSMYELGKLKGYELIYEEKRGLNAFFVDKKYYDRFGLRDNSPAKLYRPHNYKVSISPKELPSYVDENGHILGNRVDPTYSNRPIKRDAMTIEKRWILGR